MNRKITFGILLIQAFSLSLSAQTVITYKTHAMTQGDVLSLKQIDTISPGNAGPNQVWDYSSAKVVSDFVINYNANSNADWNIPGDAFACDENKERTSYFQMTATQKLYYGLTAKTAKIIFDTPIVELSFPFAYNDEANGVMKGSYTENTLTAPINGTYTTKADAWGTLILPNGVKLHNVLRVKSVRDYNHEANGSMYHVVATRYAFYSAYSRYPVLQIKSATSTCECGCNGKEYAAYFNPSVKEETIVAPKEKCDPKITYKVFPNPFDKDFELDYKLTGTAKVKICILDINGKTVAILQDKQQEEGSYSLTKDLGSYAAMNYILQIQVNDQVYTEKLIKKNQRRK